MTELSIPQQSPRHNRPPGPLPRFHRRPESLQFPFRINSALGASTLLPSRPRRYPAILPHDQQRNAPIPAPAAADTEHFGPRWAHAGDGRAAGELAANRRFGHQEAGAGRGRGTTPGAGVPSSVPEHQFLRSSFWALTEE